MVFGSSNFPGKQFLIPLELITMQKFLIKIAFFPWINEMG